MGHVGTGDGLGNVVSNPGFSVRKQIKAETLEGIQAQLREIHSVGWKSLQSFKWSNLDCTRFFA